MCGWVGVLPCSFLVLLPLLLDVGNNTNPSQPFPRPPQTAAALQVVNKYIDQGVAELVPGVLFVDEVRGSSSAVLTLCFHNESLYSMHGISQFHFAYNLLVVFI